MRTPSNSFERQRVVFSIPKKLHEDIVRCSLEQYCTRAALMTRAIIEFLEREDALS